MIREISVDDLCLVLDSTPRGAEALLPEELALADDFSKQRLQAYCSGRSCARQALHGLGAQLCPLLRTRSGAPVWPEGYTGSISHCPGLTAAGALRLGWMSDIGLDVEQIGRIERKLWPSLFGPEEQAFLNSIPREAVPAYATACFCLKECFSKMACIAEEIVSDLSDVQVTSKGRDWNVTLRDGLLRRKTLGHCLPKMQARVAFLGRHVMALLIAIDPVYGPYSADILTDLTG